MKEVFQFGGGKDSLACLHLLRDQLDHICVMWLNTGAAFPETLELMDRVRKEVPYFYEVKSDVFADIEKFGWPSDLVPTAHTGWGKIATSTSGITLRPWYECCRNNFWLPLDKACRELGATRIYRGQRISEHYKSPVRSGAIIEGIEYVFPLQSWSEQDVFDYLEDNQIEVPAYYQKTKSSLDCWNCTAYLDAKAEQVAYMRTEHPEKYRIVVDKLSEIRSATMQSRADLDLALAGEVH
jgi:3'-phosphoadenosine 5'-phosphosulfate sulfotransferase (PAPS reductase)/FAD synthetase